MHNALIILIAPFVPTSKFQSPYTGKEIRQTRLLCLLPAIESIRVIFFFFPGLDF